jgi:diguanylate cyclase (GGDEF)-like protein
MPKKKMLLMILPDSPIAEEFRDLLSVEYEIVSTDDEESGMRALLRLRDNISAVLIDLELAQENDFAFFKKVNEEALFASIPVIAALPRTPTERDMACLDAGAADIFTPPCTGTLLLKRLSNAIRAKDSAKFYEIERMLKALPSNIYLKDAEGKYIFATHYWHHLDMSADPDWTIRGKTDLEIRRDKENARLALESDKKLIASGQGTRYVIEINMDGQQEFLEIIKEPVRDDDGEVKGIVALINNVTEQQLLKRELEYRAKTDELTGLFNRHYFQETIPEILRPENFPISFIAADCNNLKRINDTFGHLAGDAYIRMTAILLRLVASEVSPIFRMGGDEFLVVLPITPEDEARQMIEELKRMESLFEVHEQKLSISYGLSVLHSEADDLQECLSKADQEMYRDKNEVRQVAE